MLDLKIEVKLTEEQVFAIYKVRQLHNFINDKISTIEEKNDYGEFAQALNLYLKAEGIIMPDLITKGENDAD